MPKRKDLRLIAGGRSDTCLPPSEPQSSEDCDHLLMRAKHYQGLTAGIPKSEISTLIADMIDAISALARLEKSEAANAKRQIDEYRHLITELKIEILSSLKG